jgi:hypothetical protein
MGTPGKTTIQARYGSFAFAATAYIAGVFLFSLWSYTAHRNTLRTHTDKSLIDAAFSLKETMAKDYVRALADGNTDTPSKFDRKQQSLIRIARHGKFNVLGVISIKDGTSTKLISASSGAASEYASELHSDNPIPKDVEDKLFRLAAAGHNDADLWTADHILTQTTLRYSVLYEAYNANHGVAYLVAQESEVMEQELAEQALRLSAVGLGMLFLAIPLIILFSRTQKKTTAELAAMNVRLQHDVELHKSREVELKDAIKDLGRFNDVSSGRESRIIELKAEVNELLDQLKREKRYNIDKID